ncbi:MAG: CooT family nickel-binding protein [Crenarchaeota archaeon]|nr:CooT family nickel-binding protein [Thermoproteota archaeon]
MCRFKVVLNGEIVATDVVRVVKENGKVKLIDTTGRTVKELENVKIVEVDSTTERIILKS